MILDPQTPMKIKLVIAPNYGMNSLVHEQFEGELEEPWFVASKLLACSFGGEKYMGYDPKLRGAWGRFFDHWTSHLGSFGYAADP